MTKYVLGCVGLGVIGLVIVVIFVLIGGAAYNSLVQKQQGVDGAWAEVENQYERRADLVKNLVATVSGAANFEKSTLVEITQARASVGQVKIDPSKAPLTEEQLQQYNAAQGQLGNALSRLLVVSERYPDLKSNQNFLDLQAQLEGTENRIATARFHFNEAAQGYNTSVKSFPTNFLANTFGFTPRPYFKAKEGADAAPDVKFDFNTPTPAAAH